MKTKIAYQTVAITATALVIFTAEGLFAQGQGPRTSTAKQALSILNSEKGTGVMKGIVALRAWDGQHQPQQWEIITTSGGGVQRYVVNGDRVLSVDSPGDVRVGRPVDVRAQSLKVDSTSAFRIADKEARSAQVGFDSVDYQLKAQAEGARPTWSVRLKDAYGQSLGTVVIDAYSGEVAERNWETASGSNDAYSEVSAGEYGELNDDYGGTYQNVSYDESGYADDAFRDPSQPRIDYSRYEGVDRHEPGRAERQRRAFADMRDRTAIDPVDARERTKSGFVRIGDSFRDIFKGRATYRSTGRNFHRANRVTKGARPR